MRINSPSASMSRSSFHCSSACSCQSGDMNFSATTHLLFVTSRRSLGTRSCSTQCRGSVSRSRAQNTSLLHIPQRPCANATSAHCCHSPHGGGERREQHGQHHDQHGQLRPLPVRLASPVG